MAGRRVMSEDLKNVEFETSEDVDVTPTFDNMGLREDLLRGIYAYGKNWPKNFPSHIFITTSTINTHAPCPFVLVSLMMANNPHKNHNTIDI